MTATRSDNGQLYPNRFAIAAIGSTILLLYWALMTFVPVPGFGAGHLDQAGNLAAYIDRWVFTPRHMFALGSLTWRGPIVYDPEGLLSSMPATVNVLLGVLTVGIWRSRHRRRVLALLMLGSSLLVAGLMLDGVFPINKKIWTSSFALLTSGVSVFALVVAAAILRAGPARYVAMPFRILGGNAIVAFSLSYVLSQLAAIPLFPGDPRSTLQTLGYGLAKQVIFNPYLAAFSCAAAVLALIFAIVWVLHRKGVHLRL